MGKAKAIVVKPISGQAAAKIIKALHYARSVVHNSQVHFGVFLNGICGGALSFGPSLDKRKVMGLVHGTKWNEFLELNRMALADWLPRNGESRALAVCMRLLRKRYPWLKWVVSYADATQCGDGTIYRAAGFVLTGIKRNNSIWQSPSGRTVCMATLSKGRHIRDTGGASMRKYIAAGWRPLAGHQLRYIYFLDPASRRQLAEPEIPYERIRQLGASMYRGQPLGTAPEA